MSTMGKSADLLPENMKLKGMCEESEDRALVDMRQTLDDTDRDSSTTNLIDKFEDVETLKNRVQEVGFDHTDVNRELSNAGEKCGCDKEENGTEDTSQTNYDQESIASHSISSSDTVLCIDSSEIQNNSNDSTETLINGKNHDHLSNGDISDNLSDTQSSVVSDQNGCTESKSKTKPKGIKSGLVMSPISLTQDIPVTVGSTSNTNRLSRVLENMPLPLLYLPNTKQLVQQNSGEKSPRSLNECDQISLSSANENSGCCASENSSINGLNVKDAGTPDGSEESASCGADSLSLREPDQLTLHSVDCLIPHVHSANSMIHGYTDVSSLSSISTGTDFSISAASLGEEYGETKSISLDMEDGGFMDVNLHSRNSYERTRNISQDSGIEDKGGKIKKKTISGFLMRNIFSRKPKENSSTESAPGWKLFGRIPPKSPGTEKDPDQISSDYQAKQRATTHFPNNGSRKKQDVEVLSTTALILENRPMNLPSKNPEEAEKHRLEYEAMVEAARKKEQRELRQRKKQMQHQLRQEDQLVAAARIWNADVLPNWDTTKGSKKARELWWIGLPPNVRGKVWRLALGNDLNITPELYEICVNRAEDRIKLMQESASDSSSYSEVSNEPPSSKEDSVQVIKLDVSRTFPQLCIFQKGGPYHDLLHSLLGAYACYRPDVGYVQGMSFIAAILLLNMDVADAFICFANLLNRPCQVTFFRMDEAMMMAYYDTFTEFFKENLPHLHDHFVEQALTPNLYLLDWIFLIYGKSLPLDVACRVWDVYCRDGEEFLFRTALGILRLYEGILINMDFIHLAQFLTKLPEDISADSLFRNIDTIRMNSDKKKFAQVLSVHREAREGLS